MQETVHWYLREQGQVLKEVVTVVHHQDDTPQHLRTDMKEKQPSTDVETQVQRMSGTDGEEVQVEVLIGIMMGTLIPEEDPQRHLNKISREAEKVKLSFQEKFH